MAASRKDRQFRRKAILRILTDDKTGPIKDQEDLVRKLTSLGIPATQASVSRDLRELGAVWVEGHYEIPNWPDDGDQDPLLEVLGFITRARVVANHFLFITTKRGAGRIVAEAVEASLSKLILGTQADDNSVLILTKDELHQTLVWRRLEDCFQPEEEDGEPRPAKGEPGPRQQPR